MNNFNLILSESSYSRYSIDLFLRSGYIPSGCFLMINLISTHIKIIVRINIHLEIVLET